MSYSVKTKYDIGDKVWYISNNGVHGGRITGFNIKIESDKTEIRYTIHYDWGTVEEGLAFPTKEELLKSL